MLEQTLLGTFVIFGLALGSAAVGAVIGLGGGFMFVPILLFLGFTPQQAVSTSLILVFFNAVSASLVFHSQGRLKLRSASQLGLLTLPCGAAGAYVASFFDTATFRVVFGVFLAAVSLYMILSKRRLVQSGSAGIEEGALRAAMNRRSYVVSAAAGFLSSLLGVGGGVLMVPSFIHLVGMHTPVATATSQFVTLFSSGVGLTSFLAMGHLEPQLVPVVALAGILGGQAGARLSRRLRARVIEVAVGIALLAVAINLLLGQT